MQKKKHIFQERDVTNTPTRNRTRISLTSDSSIKKRTRSAAYTKTCQMKLTLRSPENEISFSGGKDCIRNDLSSLI